MKTTVSVKMPDLSLDMPDQTLYRAASLEMKKRIRVRTETTKKDYLNRAFKKYTDGYKLFRAEKGRSTTPNLSFTGRMLGGMKTLVTSKFGKVILSGEEAKKARGNEKRGRIFFAFSEQDRDKVLKLVTNWVTKKNKLKR